MYMSAAEHPHQAFELSVEDQPVVGWRFDQFRLLGFGDEDAWMLVDSGADLQLTLLADRSSLPAPSRAAHRRLAPPAGRMATCQLFHSSQGSTSGCSGGDTDYPHLARIITASARGEGDDRVETAEMIASGLRQSRALRSGGPISSSPRSTTFPSGTAASGGMTRRTARASTGRRASSTPHSGDRGIGGSMLTWNEDRLREIAAPSRPVRKGHRGVGEQPERGCDQADPRRRFRGRYLYGRDGQAVGLDHLPDHRLPEGLEVRPVREEDMREIWEAEMPRRSATIGATSRRPRRGISASSRFRTTTFRLWKIAWDDEGVAGQVKSFIDTAQNDEFDRRRGWTEAIFTSRRWRRRGVAKALIVESIRELAGRGMTEVALGVHKELPNGAYGLYEGLGYEVVSTWTTYRKPL